MCNLFLHSISVLHMQNNSLVTELKWLQNTCNTGQALCPVYLHLQLSATWWRHQMEHFSRYWTFLRGIHRSLVNSPHKGQWRGALMFSLICAWINGWVNNREAGDSRSHRGHYEVIVMRLAILHAIWLIVTWEMCLWFQISKLKHNMGNECHLVRTSSRSFKLITVSFRVINTTTHHSHTA